MNKKRSILDYVSIGTLDIIFDNYCQDYEGICVAINDLDDNIVIARNFHPICSNYHRSNPLTEQLCIESNKYITEVLRTEEYIEHKCKNGLVDIAFPLYIENQRIGTFYIGQVYIEGDPTPITFFEKHAVKYGFDKDMYLATAKTINTLTHSQIETFIKRVKEDIVSLIEV